MKFVHSGKVKDVYELDKKNLLFHFTDRVSALMEARSSPT